MEGPKIGSDADRETEEKSRALDTKIVFTFGLYWKFWRMFIRSAWEVSPYKNGTPISRANVFSANTLSEKTMI